VRFRDRSVVFICGVFSPASRLSAWPSDLPRVYPGPSSFLFYLAILLINQSRDFLLEESIPLSCYSFALKDDTCTQRMQIFHVNPSSHIHSCIKGTGKRQLIVDPPIDLRSNCREKRINCVCLLLTVSKIKHIVWKSFRSRVTTDVESSDAENYGGQTPSCQYSDVVLCNI
jgi:hypothetical protein